MNVFLFTLMAERNAATTSSRFAIFPLFAACRPAPIHRGPTRLGQAIANWTKALSGLGSVTFSLRPASI